ncbi:MAG: dihydrofolate reductase [Sphingobacteriaceae bacterium]|nr:dihydrofolate reductase [Sphingobacteriaceae bacterium]
MKPKITIVVAIAQNNAIGKNNQLLWHLPADLKHFKEITSGHTIIMGRKTFESIGKALPNRKNIVISRNATLNIENIFIANSLEQAIEKCENEKEVFIIGGAEIYKQTLEICDKIELSTIHQSYEADTFFPEIDPKIWEITHSTLRPSDEKNNVDITFSTLERKKN